MTNFGRRAGDMKKSVYDADLDDVADDSEKLEGSTKSEVQDHAPKAHTHEEDEITDLDHDAEKIAGVPVDDTDKGDGKVLAYNVSSEKLEYETPTGGGPADAIRGDGTANRYLRSIYLVVDNGSNADTLKCTVGSRFNGDTIAETDNIAKEATTGNFTLSANGQVLTIEAAGLTGNVLFAIGVCHLNETGVDVTTYAKALSNDIRMILYATTNGGGQDLTALVDTSALYFDILYLTDA